MQINNLASTPNILVYYNPQFRDTLENMMAYIRSQSNNAVAVEPITIYQNAGDLRAIFNELRIPEELHWITMRINNLRSMILTDQKLESLAMPNTDVLEQIRMRYESAGA